MGTKAGIPLSLDEALLRVEDQTQMALQKVLDEKKALWEEELQARQRHILEKIDPDYIRFNIGGIEHTTTLATLTNIQGTLLYKMMMGKYPIRMDEKQRIFIDRNGNYFRYVLDCLRDGEVSYPQDSFLRARLELEYVYFELIEPKEKKMTLYKVKKSKPKGRNWSGLFKVFTWSFWKSIFQRKVVNKPVIEETCEE